MDCWRYQSTAWTLTGQTPSFLDTLIHLDSITSFWIFLLDNVFTQMINTPTRGSNVLDIFITDRPSLVESCDTVDGISDHEAIFVKSLVTARLSHPSKRTIMTNDSWS